MSQINPRLYNMRIYLSIPQRFYSFSPQEKLEKHFSNVRRGGSRRRIEQLGLRDRLQRIGVRQIDNAKEEKQEETSGEKFNRLTLIPEKEKRMQMSKFNLGDALSRHVLPPRWRRMPIDQDWPSVWPTAQSYRASTVPLPVRMGHVRRPELYTHPADYANLELMKIPNFLHLTPQAIQRHCEAIKKFLTPWPSELSSEEEMTENFPLTFLYNDYVHSGPSLRDPRARIVTLKFKLNDLQLHRDDRDKFIRLVGEERYNKYNGEVTIVTDRCPTRQQNRDYAIYLLTALYHESKKREPWESSVTDYDLLSRDWDGSQSQARAIDIVRKTLRAKQQTEDSTEEQESELDDESIKNLESMKSFGEAWERLRNNDESVEFWRDYGRKAKTMLGFEIQSQT